MSVVFLNENLMDDEEMEEKNGGQIKKTSGSEDKGLPLFFKRVCNTELIKIVKKKKK